MFYTVFAVPQTYLWLCVQSWFHKLRKDSQMPRNIEEYDRPPPYNPSITYTQAQVA